MHHLLLSTSLKIVPAEAGEVLMNDILSVGVYQPVTTGTAKESTKLTAFVFFNFMLVLRTMFSAVIYCLS